MTVTTVDRLAGVYRPKNLPSSKQRALAGECAPSVPLLSLIAFTWAFLGWLNETYLLWWDNPIWLNFAREAPDPFVIGLGRGSARHSPLAAFSSRLSPTR
jgi:hypothetical protein